MSEEEQTEVVDFAFIVKSVNGQIQVTPDPEASPTINDLFNAANSLLRDLNAQHVAGMIQQAMMAAAMQAQQEQGKTSSGIVLP